MAEPDRKGYHEPHMRPRELVHRLLVRLILPAHCERIFFLAPEIRGGHCRSNQPLRHFRSLSHREAIRYLPGRWTPAAEARCEEKFCPPFPSQSPPAFFASGQSDNGCP